MRVNAQRWEQVARIYERAMDVDPSARTTLLAEACHGDPDLRREVETLLAQEQEQAPGLMDRPVWDAAAQLLEEIPALASGTVLGPYRVDGLLGTGGMGEVYRAHDRTLNRDVALKVLPHSLGDDPDRLARFDREAQVLASLNHPNIAGIHGLEDTDGVRALVLELVEGPTLADRIAQGALPLDEALAIARQIAEALAAAHESGIIHRDLKPANIKLRPDGTVKVLDFGLAKALASDPLIPTARDRSQLPTIVTPAATRVGMIMGTGAYMSPEQARGKPLDTRTDIWAFGCVLYEMLSGRRAFDDDEVSDVLASVLAREPNWAGLPATTPPSIRRLLRRCLHKDRQERLRDIGDARIEIRDALTGADPDLAGAPPSAVRRSRTTVVIMAALALITVIAAVAIALGNRPGAPPLEVRFPINTPPTMNPAALAMSPDGHKVVFVADSAGRPRLWLRLLDVAEPRPLTGTEGVRMVPFWSPDSRSVGFFADGKLKRIDIDGGSIHTLANAPSGTSGTWSRDHVIVFTMSGSPLFSVSDSGGEPVAVTRLERQQGSHLSPHFLPDGRHVLYGARNDARVGGIYVTELGQAPSRRLLDADPGALYVASGHLLFVRQGTLFAQAFDPVRLALTGTPFTVAEQVAGASASSAGTIAYRSSATGALRQFVRFDRSGGEIGTVGDSVATNLSRPSLSPDGKRVAVYRGGNGQDVWLLEATRGAFSRFTSDAADDVMPIWSPDGKRIVFSSNRTGVHNLYEKSATVGGTETLLLSTTQMKYATDWSRDERFVLFNSQDSNRGIDIWALPLAPGGKAFPIVQTNFDEQNAQFSPEGKWIAYQSDESGRAEIYVQPFPGPGTPRPVSTNGGSQVRWRRDGKELFYVALDGRLMSVPVGIPANSGSPEIGTPHHLFTPDLGGAVQQSDYRHQYVVSADGQSFLIVTVRGGADSPIRVILNWKARP